MNMLGGKDVHSILTFPPVAPLWTFLERFYSYKDYSLVFWPLGHLNILDLFTLLKWPK